jgi:hypothetical protein
MVGGTMSGVLANIALTVVLAWVVFALAGWIVAPWAAVSLGAIVALAVVGLARDTWVPGGLVALLAPFGVMLPALALRHMGGSLGLPVVPFGTLEIIVFLGLYLAFLAASMGVVPVDPYRLGYAPVPVGAMVLAVCLYGALSGNLFLPLVAVLGQVAWVMGWGSSNWFDDVLHAVMVPVAVVVLVQRALGA